MDLSKLKLEVYDLLGLIVPGFLLVCEGWISIEGWHAFLFALSRTSGSTLTFLLLCSFGAGNAVQEVGDLIVNGINRTRHSRHARDNFWMSPDAELVRSAIKADLGHPVLSADTAFDFCLTKIKDRFGKRDLFVATSDLCRSLVVLSIFGFVPAFRTAFRDPRTFVHPWMAAIVSAAFLSSTLALMWRRMVRFRDLSEVTVFRIYLATTTESRYPSIKNAS